jgi:hypothetical protein
MLCVARANTSSLVGMRLHGIAAGPHRKKSSRGGIERVRTLESVQTEQLFVNKNTSVNMNNKIFMLFRVVLTYGLALVKLRNNDPPKCYAICKLGIGRVRLTGS